MSMSKALLLVLLAAFAPLALAVDVYRCEDAEGAVTFTDVPCQGGQSGEVLTVEIGDSQSQGLRATELEALDNMEKSMAQRREIRAARALAQSAAQAEADSRDVSYEPTVVVPGHLIGRHHKRLRHKHPSRRCADCGRPTRAGRRGVRPDDLFTVPRPRSNRTAVTGRVNF